MKEPQISRDYRIKKRKDLASVKLSRGEWADVLLWLGPQDGNDRLYDKINEQAQIFVSDEEDDD